MIMIDMPMPEKCGDCIFRNENCSCVASDYNGLGINVGCAWRTDRRDIRCPLKHIGNYYSEVFNVGYKAGQESIIRCKDCKYWGELKIWDYHNCAKWEKHIKNFSTLSNWFCGYGERRDTDGK